MAEVIIDVRVDAGTAAATLQDVQAKMKYLQDANKQLREEMKATDRTTTEGAAAYAKLSTQLYQNQQQIKSLTVSEKVLQQQGQELDTATDNLGDSFAEQARRLTVLKQQYSQLTAAERESAKGQEMLFKLQELDKQVKANDASMGNFQRNVGNYPKVFDLTGSSIGRISEAVRGFAGNATSASGVAKNAFGGMMSSVKAFGKAFLTPPVGLIVGVLTAIMLVLQKVRDAIKKNDDAGTALKKLLASFDPILKIINKAFEKLAQGIGWVADKLANFIASLSDEAAAMQEVVTATDNLEEAERQYAVNSAARSKKISELRAQVAEKDKYTAKERQAMLEEAIGLERQNMEDQKAIVAERLRLLQAEADRTADTSDEMKNKIAEAEAAMLQAETDYNNGVRRLNKELSTARKEDAAEAAKIAQDRKNATEAQAKAEAAALLEIQRMSEDAALGLIKDEGQRRYAQMQLNHRRELEALRQRLATDTELTKEAKDLLAQTIKDKETAFADEESQLLDELSKQRIDKELERLDEYDRAVTDAQKEKDEKRLEELQAQLEAELAAMVENDQLKAEEKIAIEQEMQAKLLEIKAAAAETSKQIDEEQARSVEETQKKIRASYMASAASVASVFGTMSDMLADFGEENKTAGKASKAFALTSIAISEAMNIAKTAQAITEAVTAATTAGAATGVAAPVTTPIFIAELTAAVLAGVAGTVASIKQAMSIVNKQKFGGGGVVQGDPTRGDAYPAMLTAHELVLNGEQQANLLYAVAQGGAIGTNYEAMAMALETALEAMPAPVMVYSEFEAFGQRTAGIREVAKM